MRRLLDSLTFKIGFIIVVVEVIIFIALGYYYMDRFSDEIEQRLLSRISAPGQLMAQGALSYESVGNRKTLEQIVGEDLVYALIVGKNGRVYYSLNPEDVGKPRSELPGVTWPEGFGRTDNTPVHFVSSRDKQDFLVSVSPIRLDDGRLVGFFNIKVSLDKSEAKKRDVAILFGLGTLVCVVVTSVVEVFLIRLIVTKPIRETLECVRRVEGGDLSARVNPEDSRDEIAVLQQGINSMATQLQEILGRLEREAVNRGRVAEEIRKLNEELEQRISERTTELQTANKELESFCYSVSHDLRAPLRIIDGFSQIVLEDYADKLDAEGKAHLLRLRNTSQHMAQLIEDLLKLSRFSRAPMVREPVDLSALAAAVAAEMREFYPERNVEFSVAPRLVANGDVRLLRVVLENLLANAWKFTGKTAEPRVEFGAKREDGQTVYYVRDNGVGFDMAYARKLFTPFERLHSVQEFEGSGIGLATVQRIIHRHGGRVWAEGAVDQGATFYFTLP